MRKLVLLSTLAVVPFGLADDALAGKKEKVETFLVRPDPAPDADARGRLKLETEANKDRDRLEVRGQLLDPAGSFSVFVEDAVGSGVFVLLGAMNPDADGPGEFKLKFSEKKGPLPLSLASVSDLYGRRVEVRDALSAVVLVAVVPDPALSQGKKGFSKEKAPLAIPLGGLDLDAKGRVEVWHKGKDNRERFRVKAELLDPLGAYSVQIEDAVGSGVFVPVGAMVADSDADEAGGFKLHLDTHKGDPMPTGVVHADELAGRKVQVVDGTLVVVLEGTVPDLF